MGVRIARAFSRLDRVLLRQDSRAEPWAEAVVKDYGAVAGHVTDMGAPTLTNQEHVRRPAGRAGVPRVNTATDGL